LGGLRRVGQPRGAFRLDEARALAMSRVTTRRTRRSSRQGTRSRRSGVAISRRGHAPDYDAEHLK
jgi:hypothetical protein